MAAPDGRYIAMTAMLLPAKLDDYRALHAKPWPQVTALLKAAQISDYRIYLHEPSLTLFSTFRYEGDDLDAGIAQLLEDPVAIEWHALTDACQLQSDTGERWVALDELFHMS